MWLFKLVLAFWWNPDKTHIYTTPPQQGTEKTTCPGKPGHTVTIEKIQHHSQLKLFSDGQVFLNGAELWHTEQFQTYKTLSDLIQIRETVWVLAEALVLASKSVAGGDLSEFF